VPTLDVDGCSIRYKRWSEGPPVTLLHGFTSSIEQNWVERSWIELLTAAGHQVIALDLRGHGRSTKLYDPDSYGTTVLASDVVRVFDELEVQRSDVFGFSMGAGVATQLALDARARVRRVVICGIGDAAIRGLHDPAEIAAIEKALAADDPAAVPSQLGRRVRAAAERGGNDLQALAAIARRGGWPGDLVDPTPLDLPVLLGVAGRDEYMRGTERLLELLPRAEVITVPDATHTSILGDDRFRQAVLRFLRPDCVRCRAQPCP
jgi:pimeloyl-ACP methyl ester carboxylesterase